MATGGGFVCGSGEMSPSVEGTVAPRYERVAEAFERSLTAERTEASQCCVHVHGEAVVDL
jgi:hypothetical protein